ncbi:MAG TPA: hypothetical protein VKS81_00945, partial [Bacteroidota bacterium]|nr:hypothetical protein [Bacteroidota bacterium]
MIPNLAHILPLRFNHRNGLRSIRTIALALACALVMIVANVRVMFAQTVTFNPVGWPADAQWTANTLKGAPINDPTHSDPSNGGTQPNNYVDISSGTPDGTYPSSYWAYNGTTFFIRFALQGSPDTYTPGHSVGAADPWTSGTWQMMLDLNGDGWRDFGINLDGQSGTPSSPIDKISVIYSRVTGTQSLDYVNTTGVYLCGQEYACIAYPSGANSGQAERFDGNGNLMNQNNVWSVSTTGTLDTLDFGTTRVIDNTATRGDFFLDFQISMSYFNATQFDGPELTGNTLFGAFFTTANSNSNPLQKDFSWTGCFSASTSAIAPSADPGAINQETLPKIVVLSLN